jgi:site-specific DNA recombinase
MNEITNFKKAIIYLRVSTEEQVDNYSLDTQEDICRKEAARRGYNVIEVFREEGKSAKSILGRPVLIKLLEYCRKNKKKVQAVIIYRLDRISRQTADYLAIRKKLAEFEVTLISATEPTGNSPSEKLVETILAGFAQLDNDVRSERTRNGMRARFLSGLFNAHPPLGYLLKHGYVIQDPNTFEKMKSAWDLMATGTKSLGEMSAIMIEWGFKNVSGAGNYKLSARSINRLFRSKFYIGIITSKRYPEEVRGQHTPMISEAQFYKVQAILDGRNPNKISLAHRVRDKEEFPLRRIVHCGKCGASFTGAWSKGRNKRYAYYRCSKFCTGKSVKVEVLEASLKEVLNHITPTQKGLELFIMLLEKNFYQRRSRLDKLRMGADKELERLYALRSQLVEKNLAGIYSDEIFKEQNSIIEEKIANAQFTKHDDLLERYNINKIQDFVKTKLANLGNTYDSSSLSQKKVLLGSIFSLGLTWNYFTYSNLKISPTYQYILDISGDPMTIGTPSRIRTGDLVAENHPSWATRRWGRCLIIFL